MSSSPARVSVNPLYSTHGLARAAAVVLGASAIFLARYFRITGWESLVVAAIPLAVVAVLSKSMRHVLMWTTYISGVVAFVFIRAEVNQFAPVRAAYVIAADRAMFGGSVPTVTMQNWFYTAGSPAAFDWFMVGVYLSYFLVPHLIAFYLWAFRPQWLLRYMAAVLCTLYCGLLVQALVPTVPPWLAAISGQLDPVTRIVEDALSGGRASLFAHGNRIIRPNDVAAMPSLHTAVTVIAALQLAQLWRRPGRFIGYGYAALMGLALVYLAEHYVLDVIAGVVVALIGWHVTRSLQAWRLDPATPNAANVPSRPERVAASHV